MHLNNMNKSLYNLKMFYAVQLFQFRNKKAKEPLQICWFVATLRKFYKIDSDKLSESDINAIDITALCENIVSGFLSKDSKTSFNLYISSQLMYGTLRIFKKQTTKIEEYCQNLLYNMILSFELSKDLNEKSKLSRKQNKKTAEKNVVKSLSETLLDINIQKVFPQKLPEDVHLIKEIDCHYQYPEPEFGFNSAENEENIDEIMNQLHEEIIRTEKNTDSNTIAYNIAPENELFNEVNIPLPIEEMADTEKDTQCQKTGKRSFQEILKTPVIRSFAKYGLPSESKQLLSTEFAQTAYSPPAKHRHLSAVDPLSVKLSPLLANVSQLSMSNDKSMAVSEPLLADLPNVLSPTESIVKVTLAPSLPLETSADYKESSTITASGYALQNKEALKKVEVANCKNKTIIDAIKQVDIPMQLSINACTKTRGDIIKVPPYARESVQTLFTLPSTLRNRVFSAYGRFWSSRLVSLYDSRSKTLYRCSRVRSTGLEHAEKDFQTNKRNDKFSTSTISKVPKLILQKIDLPNYIHNNNNNAAAAAAAAAADDDDNANNAERGPLEHMVIDQDNQEAIQDIGFNDIPQVFPEIKNNESVAHQSLLNTSYDDQQHNDDVIEPKIKKLKASEYEEKLDVVDSDAEQNIYLTISEFLELVKVFWNETESKNKKKHVQAKVAFEKIVTPEKNCSDEVVKYLMYCFELENKRCLDLMQEQSSTPLYILKPAS